MPQISTLGKFSQSSLISMLLLMTAMGTCFVYLLLRNSGLFISVPDEWVYSESSRLQPLSVAGVPSYLYFSLFRLTNYCGSGFIDCARVINCLSFICAMPFIYRVARLVVARGVALLVTLLAILGPISTYTAYFMPESLYFLFFWILSWCALLRIETKPVFYGAILGFIVGLMGLVKAHAIFLVPAIAVFTVARYLLSKVSRPMLKAATALVAFIGFALIVRLGLGYFFAGRAGLSLFGTIYGSVTPSVTDVGRYTRLISQAVVSVEGHVMAMTCLFAMPLAALFYFRARTPGQEGIDQKVRDIRLYTFLVLASLLAVTAIFTASVAGSNALETAARLHMRYYSFTFPLLLIIAAEQTGRASASGAFYRTMPPAVVIGALSILAGMTLLQSYTPWIVDGAELRGLTTNHEVFIGILAAGLVSLIAWVCDTRLGARIFLFIVTPLCIAFSGYYANVELRLRMVPDGYAAAGIFAKQYVGQNPGPIVVVGSDHSSLYRTLFYLDNAKASSVVVPEDGQITASNIPADAKWLLIVGNQILPKGARKQLSLGGFVLAKVGDEDIEDIDFTTGSWPGIVARKQGLSNPEPWGTWSDGDRVELEFTKPLPKKFTLVLKGHTIGDTSQPSTLVVGEDRREIRLPSPKELVFPFQTDGSIKSISIEIPWARSMRELGVSQDPRRLGIGFVSMRIITKVQAETP